MPNLSYCRFRNTLNDLRDCAAHWNDIDEDGEEELRARRKLRELCEEITSLEDL